MRESMIAAAIIAVLFYIISVIMNIKAKNFIYEKQNILLILIMVIIMNSAGLMYSYYYEYSSASMMSNMIIAIIILGGYLVFQKNRIYYFKEIDKKLIKKYKNEIIQIIEDYITNYTSGNSEITFVKNRIVFEKVSKKQSEECLSLIGNFLNENRREYSLKDYLLYIVKGHAIPLILLGLVIYMLFKFLRII